jgi:uncharacterized protein YycO
MLIALYKGTSFTSKLIRWFTRSQYSHAAVMLDNHTVIESWQKVGVVHAMSLWQNHNKKTEIDLYTITDLPINVEQDIIYNLKKQVGKKYDWLMVFRFVSRRPENEASQNKWFCSEVLIDKFAFCGWPLLNALAYMVAPGHIAWSTRLKFYKTVKSAKDL